MRTSSEQQVFLTGPLHLFSFSANDFPLPLIDETLGVELAVDAVGDLCRRYPPSDSVEHSANCLVRLVVRAMTAFAVLPALFAAFPPFALDKKVFVRFMVMAPHTHYPLAFFLIFIFRTAL